MSELSPFGHAVAGGISGMVGLACTYPLDVIKTRMQAQSKVAAHGTDYKNAWDAARKILAADGVHGLYVGLSSGLLATLMQQFVYFYWYELLKPVYQGLRKAELSTFWQLLLGVHAASFNSITTLPITVINTRIQTALPDQRKGIVGTMMEIVREEGVAGLYKGIQPALVLSINPAITFLFYEKLKTIWETRIRAHDPKGRLSSFQFFVIGAVAKTIATVVTYPYIMAKTRLQSKYKDDREELKYKNTFDVLRKVYRSEGLLGWVTGLETQIFKAVLTQAIQLMAKEEIAAATVRLMALVAAHRAHKAAGSKSS
eukprot:Unigene12567_Nuclearia_a/m.38173 Unigene12567_Nuclearia_a/g.38173  ORF Unigene12567_Nuclearia_a/g.38173 Unigene12567_Nuclearia_a/m.38173 type:complete len:314 (-) Unigene12567_Nuclearia_a:48-989(-)